MKHNKWLMVGLGFACFAVLGLFDGMRGVAWPSMRETFGQSVDALGTVLLAGSLGHSCISVMNGRLLSRTTFLTLLLTAFTLTGSGLFFPLFVINWWLFVAGIFVYGIGAGLLNASMNTFISIKWEPRFIHWLHACYSIGAMGGTTLMTFFVSQGIAWQVGLAMVVVAYLLLALSFWLTRPLWILKEETNTTPEEERYASTVRFAETLRVPMVWLSVMLFVLHAGIGISVGNWSFTVLTESRHLSASTAGSWVTAYWLSMIVARVLVGFVSIDGSQLLRMATVGLAVGAGLFCLTAVPMFSFLGLVLVGLSIAPVFPALVAQTPQRLAMHAPNGMGLQLGVSGIGGSLLSALAGYLGEWLYLEMIALFLFCLTILFFLAHEVVIQYTRKKTVIICAD